jgi:hypothetical protein
VCDLDMMGAPSKLSVIRKDADLALRAAREGKRKRKRKEKKE